MARNYEEDRIHEAVVTHLNIRGALGMVFFHVPNSPRSARNGARLKRMGARAGVSDLVLFHNERLYCLELKAPGGRASESQMEFMADMGLQGAFTCIVDSLDRAIKVLECWGLLVGKTT